MKSKIVLAGILTIFLCLMVLGLNTGIVADFGLFEKDYLVKVEGLVFAPDRDIVSVGIEFLIGDAHVHYVAHDADGHMVMNVCADIPGKVECINGHVYLPVFGVIDVLYGGGYSLEDKELVIVDGVKTFRFMANETWAVVDDNQVPLNNALKIIDGSLYLPLEVFEEVLSTKVEWIEDNYLFSITKTFDKGDENL